MIREYLKKIKPYKDKLKDKQKYAGSNFDKLLGYIERIEFAVFGNSINNMQESEKLDIATGGDDEVRKSVIESISKMGDTEEPNDIPKLETEEEAAEKRIKGDRLKIMTLNQLITRLSILLAQKTSR